MMTERTKDTFIVGRMIIAAKRGEEESLLICFLINLLSEKCPESHNNKSIKKANKEVKGTEAIMPANKLDLLAILPIAITVRAVIKIFRTIYILLFLN